MCAFVKALYYPKADWHARIPAAAALSAVPLLDEIRAAGYTGGYTQLRELVRRPEIRPREASSAAEPTADGVVSLSVSSHA